MEKDLAELSSINPFVIVNQATILLMDVSVLMWMNAQSQEHAILRHFARIHQDLLSVRVLLAKLAILSNLDASLVENVFLILTARLLQLAKKVLV